MALSMRRFILLPVIKRRKHFLHKLEKRCLLNDADLKLEGYLRQRIFKMDQLGCNSGRASFTQKLQKVKTPKEAKHAFLGIIDLMHTAETDEELSELERLFKLISMNKAADLEYFTYGASLMRMYHHLGLPDRAYKMYKDEMCGKFICDNTCHKVLMDLLYKHQQFDKVLDVFSGLQTFNIDCVTLVFGAYYHINTQESHETAQELTFQLLKTFPLSRRALLFVAMLALNQNHPKAALKTLKFCNEGVLPFNLELMCHARLGSVQEVLKRLDEAKLKSDDITRPLNVRIYTETLMEIKHAVAASDSESVKLDFEQLEKELSTRGVFSKQTLAVLINRTITSESNYKKETGKNKKRIRQQE